MSRQTESPEVVKPKKHRREHGSSAKKSSKKRRHTTAEPQSAFYVQTTSFYLALSPVAQSTPLEGLCAEHLSPLILTYYPPLKGVVLSYTNARLSNSPEEGPKVSETQVLSRSVDEYAVTFVWMTADFTILKPERGVEIEGYVSVQSESHLGLVCWNLFNASIDRRRLPKGWRWVGHTAGQWSFQQADNEALTDAQEESTGHFVDENGNPVDGIIKFRVRDFESLPDFGKEKGFMSIEGTMLDDEEEQRLGKDDNGEAHALRGAMRRSVNGGISSQR